MPEDIEITNHEEHREPEVSSFDCHFQTTAAVMIFLVLFGLALEFAK